MKQCPLHILQDCNSNCALYDEVTENCSISLGADALCFLADSLAKEIKDNKTMMPKGKHRYIFYFRWKYNDKVYSTFCFYTKVKDGKEHANWYGDKLLLVDYKKLF